MSPVGQGGGPGGDHPQARLALSLHPREELALDRGPRVAERLGGASERCLGDGGRRGPHKGAAAGTPGSDLAWGSGGDYVPFYFAARSPMLYTICRGNVPAYQGGQDPLVYLVTEPTQLQQLGCRFVFTDRNAYYAMADYADDLRRLDDLVDWELMESKMWNNTEAEPDRIERRMAEFLVHGAVPFGAFIAVGVRSEQMVDTVQRVLAALSAPPRVVVRRDWYFEGRP
jgi:hypothetical protein